MVITAKSLKNPQYLSLVISKLTANTNNSQSTEAEPVINNGSRLSILPKLDETFDEEILEQTLDDSTYSKNKKNK